MNFCTLLPRSALQQQPHSVVLLQNSSRAFSTSSAVCAESKRKRLARLRKAANVSRRASMAQQEAATAPDLILGYNPSLEQGRRMWEESKLAQILLKPEQVWGISVAEARKSSGSMPSLDEGLEPEHAARVKEPTSWNFGLQADEAKLLFEALPEANTRRTTSTDMSVIESLAETEQDKSDQLKRILDLKNASAKGVAVENTRRIVEAFGRSAGDTGTPEVQGQLQKETIAK